MLENDELFHQVCRVSNISPNSAPIELRVQQRGATLVIAWPDGTNAALTASALRQACRCASCISIRTKSTEVMVARNLAIATIQLVGVHAVNIGFSDGHARGIYPWPFLRELCRR